MWLGKFLVALGILFAVGGLSVAMEIWWDNLATEPSNHGTTNA